MRKLFFGLLFLLCSVFPVNAAPAAGVQLGSEFVPREKFVVFLMIGHCNMIGQAKHPEEGSHPRAWQLDLKQRPPRWVPAIPRNDSNNLGAPTLPFLQTLAAQYPDYHFGVINNATSAAYVHSNYRRGQSNYTQIVSLARSLKPYATIGGVATMMGYMEAEHAALTAAFPEQFAAMMHEMRADLGEPNLPFFITQFEVGATKKGPGWTAIANSLAQMPQRMGNATVISTENFAYDSDHHPSYQSFKLWAKRMAQAVGALSAPRWLATANTTPPKFEVPAIVQPAAPRPIQKPTLNQRLPEKPVLESPLSTVTAPPPIVAEVEAVLLKASQAPDLRQISPYKEAVASAQFEVRQVLKGHLDSRRVLAMQMVIEKNQLLPAANLKVGATYRLKLSTWNSVPRYHTYPMADDIMDFESPIFFVHGIESIAAHVKP